MDRVDQRYALHKLTALEADACLNAMQHSPHARLRVRCRPRCRPRRPLLEPI